MMDKNFGALKTNVCEGILNSSVEIFINFKQRSYFNIWSDFFLLNKLNKNNFMTILTGY